LTGTLYLLPTALGDSPWTRYLAPDSRDVARKITYFAVENAKSARAELKRIGHPVALRELSIRQLPETMDDGIAAELLQPLRSGHDLGLMSEAGCPGVADPGASLVRLAHAAGIQVQPLVGASALLLALMASGLEGQRFAFHGYLPQREPERSRRIQDLETESARRHQTQLFIETPYRNRALYDALLAACHPATLLCVATDLTLPSEEIRTRVVADWRAITPPALERRPSVFLMLSAR